RSLRNQQEGISNALDDRANTRTNPRQTRQVNVHGADGFLEAFKRGEVKLLDLVPKLSNEVSRLLHEAGKAGRSDLPVIDLPCFNEGENSSSALLEEGGNT